MKTVNLYSNDELEPYQLQGTTKVVPQHEVRAFAYTFLAVLTTQLAKDHRVFQLGMC